MFDRWDHTLQTGNDAEWNLVILALCVGATLPLGELLSRLVQSSQPRQGRFLTACFAESVPQLLGTVAPINRPLSLRI